MPCSERVEGVRTTRVLLAVILSVPLYQVIEGVGVPDTSHRNVTDWPIDAETVAGVTIGMSGRKMCTIQIIISDNQLTENCDLCPLTGDGCSQQLIGRYTMIEGLVSHGNRRDKQTAIRQNSKSLAGKLGKVFCPGEDGSGVTVRRETIQTYVLPSCGYCVLRR